MNTRKPGHLTTLVTATVMGMASCLAVAAPARAFPPQGSDCTQFGFKGPFVIKGQPSSRSDSRWTVSFDSTGTTASGPAVVVFDSGERVTGHVVSGGGIGGRNVKFRVQYDDKPNNFWDFTGTVHDDGSADGSEALAGGNLPATWTSAATLDCLAPAPPLIVGIPRVDPPAQAPPPPVAPTDAIRVVFDRKGLSESVTVVNDADLSGKCTYLASPVGNAFLPTVNRSFDIGANGTASLTVPAPPPLTTYHVVVSCRGTFDGKNVEFGHVEQDVS